MDLLKEIRNDIINETVSISSILRKARVLASLLKDDKFEKWVLSELNGYDENDKDIPKYRIIYVDSTGDFSGPFGRGAKNMPIPTMNLPKIIKEFTNDTKIIQGVKSIESLTQADSNTLVLNWPPEYIAVCQSKIYARMNLYSARKVISKSEMLQILDTIRNRLLDFILELQKKNPEIITEELIPKIPEKDIKLAFDAHISGSYNSSKK